MQYAGRDGSEPFNRLHSPAAKRLLHTLLVGELDAPAGSAQHHSEAASAQQRGDGDGDAVATHSTRQQAAAAEAAAVAVAQCVNVDDVQRLAAGRLSVGAAAYYSAGAEDGVSLADNLKMWGGWALRPRVLVDVSRIDLTTRVLGVEVTRSTVLVVGCSSELCVFCLPVGSCQGTTGNSWCQLTAARCEIPL